MFLLRGELDVAVAGTAYTPGNGDTLHLAADRPLAYPDCSTRDATAIVVISHPMSLLPAWRVACRKPLSD